MNLYPTLVELVQEALVLALVLALPAAGAALVVSWLMGAVQAATHIYDATLSHLPRLLVVAWVLTLAGPWLGGQLASFATRALLAP